MKNKLHSLPRFWKVVICVLAVLTFPLWIFPLILGYAVWLLLDTASSVIFDHGICGSHKEQTDGYESFCKDMWEE